jgi:hypothetical protein
MHRRDVGTSRLAQGCIGQLHLVDASPFVNDPSHGHDCMQAA